MTNHGHAALGGLLLALVSVAAPAADWAMLQGTEPADAGPYRFFGAAWLTYANNFGCDAFAGLRNPNGTPGGSPVGGPALKTMAVTTMPAWCPRNTRTPMNSSWTT